MTGARAIRQQQVTRACPIYWGLKVILFRGREAHGRSLAKAVSWRITGTVDTFIISFIITGEVATAGSIAATELVTKICLYYFHERIWTLISWGHR
jgi:uncharacterized membrane protein